MPHHPFTLAVLLGVLLSLAPHLRAQASPTTEISATDPATRLAWLQAELARHDALYFQKATPEISDFAYDQLKREFHNLCALHPQLAAALPPTPANGDDRNGLLPTHAHLRPMLGLAKAYTTDELRAFLRTVEKSLARETTPTEPTRWYLEPKYDGLAFSALYENGRLIRVLTRGNGLLGDDITAQVRATAALPDRLKSTAASPTPTRIELRGELFFTLAEFTRLNLARTQAGEPAYAHPRNLAVGTAKHTDLSALAGRKLSAVVYACGDAPSGARFPDTHEAFLALVKTWGLPTPSPTRTVETHEALIAAIEELGVARHTWPMPTDGVVLKLDSFSQRTLLGESDDAPRWALAYKFDTERLSTRLRAITWQVGRTGALTPVAELEPVTLGGATLTRATLHNATYLRRLDARIGDHVFIEKAGEIIPAITGIDLARRPAGSPTTEIPDRCPSCQSALDASSACPSADCPARWRARLLHFASPSGVGIKGLGDATADMLIAQARVKNLADLYRLRREDLMALPGIGEKTADKLLAEIEKSRHADAARFLTALGFTDIGAASAKKIAAALPALPALLELESSPELLRACALSPAQTEALLRQLRLPETRRELEALIALGVAPTGFALNLSRTKN